MIEDITKKYLSESQIGNKMIFRATALKDSPNEGAKKQVTFYLQKDGDYVKWEGYQGKSGMSITKDGMTKEKCDELIKVFSADKYKIEDFR